MTQLPLTDMQRAYVKVIGGKAYLRVEKYIVSDKPVEEALENIRTTLNLDKDILGT